MENPEQLEPDAPDVTLDVAARVLNALRPFLTPAGVAEFEAGIARCDAYLAKQRVAELEQQLAHPRHNGRVTAKAAK